MLEMLVTSVSGMNCEAEETPVAKHKTERGRRFSMDTKGRWTILSSNVERDTCDFD